MVRHPGSTAVVPLFEDSTILMERQYRHAVGGYLLEIPAGTMEPGEKMVPYVAEAVGDDVVCYSSDYCHWDCDFPDSVKLVEECDLSDAYKRKLFAVNAARFYGLEIP